MRLLLEVPAYVDRDMWEKIVFNLVSNAFKFTLAGGITVRLSKERRHDSASGAGYRQRHSAGRASSLIRAVSPGRGQLKVGPTKVPASVWH